MVDKRRLQTFNSLLASANSMLEVSVVSAKPLHVALSVLKGDEVQVQYLSLLVEQGCARNDGLNTLTTSVGCEEVLENFVVFVVVHHLLVLLELFGLTLSFLLHAGGFLGCFLLFFCLGGGGCFEFCFLSSGFGVSLGRRFSWLSCHRLLRCFICIACGRLCNLLCMVGGWSTADAASGSRVGVVDKGARAAAIGDILRNSRLNLDRHGLLSRQVLNDEVNKVVQSIAVGLLHGFFGLFLRESH